MPNKLTELSARYQSQRYYSYPAVHSLYVLFCFHLHVRVQSQFETEREGEGRLQHLITLFVS